MFILELNIYVFSKKISRILLTQLADILEPQGAREGEKGGSGKSLKVDQRRRLTIMVHSIFTFQHRVCFCLIGI